MADHLFHGASDPERLIEPRHGRGEVEPYDAAVLRHPERALPVHEEAQDRIVRHAHLRAEPAQEPPFVREQNTAATDRPEGEGSAGKGHAVIEEARCEKAVGVGAHGDEASVCPPEEPVRGRAHDEAALRLRQHGIDRLVGKEVAAGHEGQRFTGEGEEAAPVLGDEERVPHHGGRPEAGPGAPDAHRRAPVPPHEVLRALETDPVRERGHPPHVGEVAGVFGEMLGQRDVPHIAGRIGFEVADLALRADVHRAVGVDGEPARDALVRDRDLPPPGAVVLEHPVVVAHIDQPPAILHHRPRLRVPVIIVRGEILPERTTALRRKERSPGEIDGRFRLGIHGGDRHPAKREEAPSGRQDLYSSVHVRTPPCRKSAFVVSGTTSIFPYRYGSRPLFQKPPCTNRSRD